MLKFFVNIETRLVGMMNIALVIAMISFGLIAGVVGGLLGIGGCSIMLPALCFIFGYDLPVAVGTTITAVVVTAISGAAAHIRMRNIDYETTKLVAIPGAVGAILGSIAFVYLSGNMKMLSGVIGVAFLYAAARMTYEGITRRAPKGASSDAKIVPGSKLAKSVIGLVIGFLAGLIGLGGGYALVPSFIYILGSPVKIAVGTSLASFVPMSVVSSAFKLASGHVDPLAAVLLGAGTAIGAQLGAKLVPRTPSWAIKLLFGLLFLYVSVKFILRAF